MMFEKEAELEEEKTANIFIIFSPMFLLFFPL